MGENILLGPLVLFAAAMCLTPGPNVVMVTASAANFGFRRTLPQILGITLGFAAMVLAAAYGLAGLFKAEPRLHLWLKYAGLAYLLYLAWRIARADAASARPAGGRPISFFEAALITWLNPKGWVTTLGALAAYTTGNGNIAIQGAVIAAVLGMACGISVVIWAGFGAAITRLLSTARARKVFTWTMAGLLIVSLLPVFL